MRGRTTWVVAALSLALLAGCGDDTRSSTANPNARTPSPSSAPAAPPVTAEPSTAAPAPSDDAAPEDAAGADASILVTDDTGFSSPSGNIRCEISPDDDYVRCDIGEREWEAPEPPEDCELDYGSGLYLDREGADVVCAGDAVGGDDLTLEYGERLQGGAVVCESAQTGMTCTNGDTGEGFSISRATYELF
jgi:hypothetical protein